VRNTSPPPGFDPRTVQPVASRYTDCAIPVYLPNDDDDDDNNNNNNNEDLTMEIQRMWNVKTKVIPVIIGATGTISKSFRKYVSNIPGKHEVKELQKKAILGIAHILRKALM